MDGKGIDGEKSTMTQHPTIVERNETMHKNEKLQRFWTTNKKKQLTNPITTRKKI